MKDVPQDWRFHFLRNVERLATDELTTEEKRFVSGEVERIILEEIRNLRLSDADLITAVRMAGAVVRIAGLLGIDTNGEFWVEDTVHAVSDLCAKRASEK